MTRSWRGSGRCRRRRSPAPTRSTGADRRADREVVPLRRLDQTTTTWPASSTATGPASASVVPGTRPGAPAPATASPSGRRTARPSGRAEPPSSSRVPRATAAAWPPGGRGAARSSTPCGSSADRDRQAAACRWRAGRTWRRSRRGLRSVRPAHGRDGRVTAPAARRAATSGRASVRAPRRAGGGTAARADRRCRARRRCRS